MGGKKKSGVRQSAKQPEVEKIRVVITDFQEGLKGVVLYTSDPLAALATVINGVDPAQMQDAFDALHISLKERAGRKSDTHRIEDADVLHFRQQALLVYVSQCLSDDSDLQSKFSLAATVPIAESGFSYWPFSRVETRGDKIATFLEENELLADDLTITTIKELVNTVSANQLLTCIPEQASSVVEAKRVLEPKAAQATASSGMITGVSAYLPNLSLRFQPLQRWGSEKLTQTYSAASSYLSRSWVSRSDISSSDEHVASEPVVVSQVEIKGAPVLEPVVSVQPVAVFTDEMRLAASIKVLISEFVHKPYHAEQLAEFMRKDLHSMPQNNFWRDSRALILAALPRGKTDYIQEVNRVCESLVTVHAFREALKRADSQFTQLSQLPAVVVDDAPVVTPTPLLAPQEQPIVAVPVIEAVDDDEEVVIAPVVENEHEDEQQDNDDAELGDANDEDQLDAVSHVSKATYIVSPRSAALPHMTSVVYRGPSLPSSQSVVKIEEPVFTQPLSLPVTTSESSPAQHLAPTMMQRPLTTDSAPVAELRPRSISAARPPSPVDSEASSQACERPAAMNFEAFKELLREKLSSYMVERAANKHEYYGGPFRLFKPGFSKTDKLSAVTLLIQYANTGDYHCRPEGSSLKALNNGKLKAVINDCLQHINVAPKTINGLLNYIQEQHQSRMETGFYK